ncbi:MAG: hypothetical protein J6Y02_24970 [Pseudobutyrivibrio sp.]|nr:hypothetical protein [Pseudobutyrivibrio sp.]
MALSGNFNTTKYTTSSSGSIGLNLSWTGTQSVSDNTTTIKWTLKSNGTMSSGYSVQGGPITVTIGGVTVLNQTGRFKVNGGGAYKKTGTLVVHHNEDGTKSVAMSVRAALYSASVNCTGSYTYKLDTINRYAYITSVPNFDDESDPVMNYANPLGDALSSTQACISLDGTNPSIAYRDIDINGSSYTFNLTSSERDILRAACPNSSTLTVYFIIKSVMEGDTYYSKKTAVMSIVNGSPEITNAEYYDTNSETIAVTHDVTKIIQALSVVEFKFGSLTALKHATLVSASITINGIPHTISLSGTTQTNVTKSIGELNLSSSLPAVLDVVDSRGLHTTQELTVHICAWSIPTGVVNLERINNFYTETNLRVRASYSSIDGQNDVVITYQSKKVTDADYSSEITIQDNTTTVVSLDNRYEWNVKVKITDLVGGSTTYNLTVGKGIPIIFFDRLKKSMGINCFPSEDECLEIAGKLITNKIGLQDISNQYTVTKSSGAWTFKELQAVRSGNTVMLAITFTSNNTTINAGSTPFSGTISGGPLPVISAKTVSYYSDCLAASAFQPNGTITVRWTINNLNIQTNDVTLNFTFITDD